jgi:diguanylate cyclase
MLVAVSLGLFTASLIIWPHWIAAPSFQLSGSSVAAEGVGPQNLLVFACILGLTCLNLVSLMLPDTTDVVASMAELTEKIAEPDLTVSGIEREVAANLDRIIALLKNHSEASRLYSVSLENAGRNLIEMTSPAQLRIAIGYLIAENNKMRSETNNLQSNLNNSHMQIENLRENLEIAEEAGMRDSLTSLWNRRAFDKMLDLQIELSISRDVATSLILADIDHFKKINDNFGHLIGDEILKLVAGTISKTVKGRDIVARFGGEEFGLILPQTSLENAIRLADQIRRQLEIQQWVVSKRNQAVGTVTASFGVAQLQHGETRDAFIGRADRKLYDAKGAGRNRIAS